MKKRAMTDEAVPQAMTTVKVLDRVIDVEKGPLACVAVVAVIDEEVTALESRPERDLAQRRTSSKKMTTTMATKQKVEKL